MPLCCFCPLHRRMPLVGDRALRRHKMHPANYRWHNALLTILKWNQSISLRWVGPRGSVIPGIAGLHLWLPPSAFNSRNAPSTRPYAICNAHFRITYRPRPSWRGTIIMPVATPESSFFLKFDLLQSNPEEVFRSNMNTTRTPKLPRMPTTNAPFTRPMTRWLSPYPHHNSC